MNFEQICRFVLNEKYEGKYFDISEDMDAIIEGITSDEVKLMIKRTALALDKKHIKRLVLDFEDFVPATIDEITAKLQSDLASMFDTTLKKAGRAATHLFRFLKKKGVFTFANHGGQMDPEAVIGDEESEWLGGGNEPSISDVEKMTGGFDDGGF